MHCAFANEGCSKAVPVESSSSPCRPMTGLFRMHCRTSQDPRDEIAHMDNLKALWVVSPTSNHFLGHKRTSCRCL